MMIQSAFNGMKCTFLYKESTISIVHPRETPAGSSSDHRVGLQMDSKAKQADCTVPDDSAHAAKKVLLIVKFLLYTWSLSPPHVHTSHVWHWQLHSLDQSESYAAQRPAPNPECSSCSQLPSSSSPYSSSASLPPQSRPPPPPPA